MEINNKSGLTVMIGLDKQRILANAFDTLTVGAINQYTYYIKSLNVNIRNYVYNLIKHHLSIIEEDVQKKNVKTPIVLFITEFDYMQDVTELDKIKKMLYNFIKKMSVPVHIYVAGNTYELCRNEEILVSHTGDIMHFKDYEEYRQVMLSFKK